MWCCFEPGPRRVFLSSAKLPTSAPRPTTLPGRRWLYGPTVASSSIVDDSTTLAHTLARCPTVEFDELAPRADHAAVADPGRAPQDHVRLERHVPAELDRPVEVDRRRVAHRDAIAHVRLVETDPKAPLGRGELRAIVDPVEPPVVIEADRADDAAVLTGEADQVGQVELPADRGRLERVDAPSEPGGIERVEPRVDLVARQLLGARVPGLDDALHRAELAPDHPAELVRIRGKDAGQGDRRVVCPASLEDRVEVGAGDQRDVAAEDEDLHRVVRDRRHRGADRVARPTGLVLEGERRAVREGGPDGLDRRRVDDDGRGLGAGGGARPGVQDVGQHRAPAERVQHLRGGRAHARSEPSRQHHRDRTGRRARTWGVHEGRRRRGMVRERSSFPTRSGSGARGSAVITGSAHRRGASRRVSTEVSGPSLAAGRPARSPPWRPLAGTRPRRSSGPAADRP